MITFPMFGEILSLNSCARGVSNWIRPVDYLLGRGKYPITGSAKFVLGYFFSYMTYKERYRA